jgi:SAM-dependent methyltransferase
MPTTPQEYKRMFDAEEQLWWYQILHEIVLENIQKQFSSKDIRILDAGCGTGGLLAFLRKHGYQNLSGFDYSAEAIAFSQQRGFDVRQAALPVFADKFSSQKFDIIICNDVLCYLNNDQIRVAYQNIEQLISEEGVFLTNNNAFSVFSGTHDIAVGVKQRFTHSHLIQLLPEGLRCHYFSYWPFLLSPLIMATRIFQKIQIKLGLIDTQQVVSDVAVPPKYINQILYKLIKFERKLGVFSFFGSSVFLAIKRHKM